MEAAVQQRRAARHLLEGVVLPQHLVAPVRADVVEGADHAVLAPHDDDRGVEELQLAGEVAARLGHTLDPPDVEPGLLEDVLALFLVELFGNAVLERHRTSAQFGMSIGPMSTCRLGDQGFLTHEALLRATLQLRKLAKQTQNRNTLLHIWNRARGREEHKKSSG